MLVVPDLHRQLEELALAPMGTAGAPRRQSWPFENNLLWVTYMHFYPLLGRAYVTCVTVRSDVVHILFGCQKRKMEMAKSIAAWL
jgi:hypothetical protein